MAQIDNLGPMTAEEAARVIKSLSDEQLTAVSCVQQGGINALSHLLTHGISEAHVLEMLAALRLQAGITRREAVRRGLPVLFPADQTGFS